MAIPIPETEGQFLAKMLLATRRGDQISRRDATRLEILARTGTLDHSPGDLEPGVGTTPNATVEEAIARGATRVQP